MLTKAKPTIIYLILLTAFYFLFFTPATPIGKFFLADIPAETPVLDVQSGYTVEEAYETITIFADKGRLVYLRNLLTIDIILPILYGLAFSSLIELLFFWLKVESPWERIGVMIPWLAAFSDVFENLTISGLIFMYPQQIPLLAQIANVFSVGKSYLLSATIILIGIQLVWLAGKGVLLFVKFLQA